MDVMSVSSENPRMTAPSMAQVIMEVLGRADRAIDIDPRQARIFIGQASRLLQPTINSTRRSRTPPSLAPWQERKVLHHIGRHLDQAVRNDQLAAVVGLSIGHFSRCFRGSFGISPREYLIRSRIERAKAMMRQTPAPLSQIALDSGFADQAHMSRHFHAFVGMTPTRWRRAKAIGDSATEPSCSS